MTMPLQKPVPVFFYTHFMDINEYARAYEVATKYFADHVATLSDSDLDRSRPGEWSPRQVIHHVADSEAQSYARLRRLIAEPAGSQIQGYDEAGWGENQTLGYKELPIANSLAVYLAVRASSLDIIKRLRMEDLERYGEHTERGRYTVRHWLELYTKHPRDHAEQMMAALAN